MDDQGVKRLDLGQHRVRPAAETFERVWRERTRFGVTRIANVTGLDRIGIPVTLAIRPDARSVAVSQGKGIDLAAARASGLMEAVELWHAERPRADLRFGTYERLAEAEPVVDIAALPVLERGGDRAHEPMLWARGHDLEEGRPVLVPFEMVHADYCEPGYPGHGLYPASTNGLASGGHRLEAILHGLYEVVERDAISLFFGSGNAVRAARRVDLSSVDGMRALPLLARYEEANIPIAVWDITSDLGLATFYAAIGGAGGDGHVGIGSGTHLDRDAALTRALTEAAQTRMTYVTGSRDDLAGDEFEDAGRAEKVAMVEHLRGAGGGAH